MFGRISAMQWDHHPVCVRHMHRHGPRYARGAVCGVQYHYGVGLPRIPPPHHLGSRSGVCHLLGGRGPSGAPLISALLDDQTRRWLLTERRPPFFHLPAFARASPPRAVQRVWERGCLRRGAEDRSLGLGRGRCVVSVTQAQSEILHLDSRWALYGEPNAANER